MAEGGRSGREIKQTEKGLQFQVDTKSKEFNFLMKSWGRSANKLRTLLADESDASTIKKARDCLQTNVDKLIQTQEELMALRLTAEIEDDSIERLDEIEEEHNEIMKQTLEVLISLRDGNSLPRSSAKKSKKAHSVRSKGKDCQDWVNAIPERPAPEVQNERQDTQDTQAESIKLLIEQMRMTRLPLPEPPVFVGDPLSFPAWKHAFDILIQQSGVRASDRFFYLQKYLRGQPLELVRGYALIGDNTAYKEALSALEERYGDKYTIANAFRDKLERWPKISPKDAIGLRNLSDFLKQCAAAMNKIGNLHQLNDERENQKLLAKLPDWLVARWSRRVIECREVHGLYPPFETFVRFVEEEAKIACYPVTTSYELKDERYRKGRHNTEVRSLHTKSSPNSNQKERKEKTNKPRSCSLCKNDHLLEDCSEFASKNMTDRKKYIKEKGLCYGCLKAGHMSKNCRRRSTCDICQGRHPSCLHEDRNKPEPEKEQDVDARLNGTQTWSHANQSHAPVTTMKSTMIVPVMLSHSKTSDERMVYALLDTQSDTTFLMERTKDEMNLHGVPVNLLLSTMSAMDERVSSERIDGLLIRSVDGDQQIPLPTTYTRKFIPANRNHIPTPEMANSIPHLSKISDHLLPLQDCEVSLLIGYDCSRALIPREVIPPNDENGPYGLKTDLGWSIVGTVKESECIYDDDPIGVSHRTAIRLVPEDIQVKGYPSEVILTCPAAMKEEINPVPVNQNFEADLTSDRIGKPYSQNDLKFVRLMEKEIHITDDGHYEMPLPFKEEHGPVLPNNRFVASRRLNHLRKKFEEDDAYYTQYLQQMNNLLEKKYAERVLEQGKPGKLWYIPHHGVQQPRKLRVVFDCSSQFKGESLNTHLLTGPDLTNTLAGVLCRFRKEKIAFMCDIKEMFYQFHVNQDDRDYLRFLWWSDGDFRKEPVDYRMNVHIFGAGSSPGCANFGLKQIAKDKADDVSQDAAEFIQRDFYVDDGLKSTATEEEAIKLISDTKKICEHGGLHVHKVVSNSRKVLESVPIQDRATDVKELNLLLDRLPIEKALGVQWCIESDTFRFRMTFQDKPLTRRGILSTVMSVYDPLGLFAPLLLPGKLVLQDLCKSSFAWDDPLSEELQARWNRWKLDMVQLRSISINRCYKPEDFGDVKNAELHYFCDASNLGYGQCTYLRMVNDKGEIHCTLVMGKSRVAPIKAVTVPRLELTAAVLAVRVRSFLRAELDLHVDKEIFWTDSRVVLGYINNESRRFQVFVANRIRQIRDESSPDQWRYVCSQENPADGASRGMTVDQLQASKWLLGPEILWEKSTPTDVRENYDVVENDPEVKKSRINVSQSRDEVFALERLQRFSTWTRARRTIANCLNFIARLRQRCKQGHESEEINESFIKDGVTAANLHRSEMMILKHIQKEVFSDEIQILRSIQNDKNLTERKRKHQIKKSSLLHGLDAFLDQDDILRVGGRIRRANDSYVRRHPVILPKDHHITDLIIRHCHDKAAHQGRGMTLNEIRQSGYWVPGGSSRVSKLIRKCVICNKLRSSTQIQKMSDLPSDRVTETTPFTYCGMDCFGPWVIKEGRKEMKRYGILFTCMASRAVHIETLNSLTTDSFIQAFRRFSALRGPVQQLRCDRGTNFVGAEAEFRKSWLEMDHQKVKNSLLTEGCDYVHFAFNVPSASHMGGVWERQIRSIRSVMGTLLHQSGRQLDDESLRTLMCETAAVINSRPLTVTHINDPTYPAPLTPNHLIIMKSKVLLPPPGNFQSADLYSRKRWRRVQHLINDFWNRWKKEYIQNLQVRQKWTRPQREARIGDVVIVKDDNAPRNLWPLARITEVSSSDDGHIRKVKLAMGNSRLDDSGKREGPLQELERPIHKLVLLLPREDQ